MKRLAASSPASSGTLKTRELWSEGTRTPLVAAFGKAGRAKQTRPPRESGLKKILPCRRYKKVLDRTKRPVLYMSARPHQRVALERKVEISMLTNQTSIARTRKVATTVAATPWQPVAKNYGAAPVVLCALGLNSLPTSFIGGGQLQGQTGSLESMTLSDRRHQYQV